MLDELLGSRFFPREPHHSPPFFMASYIEARVLNEPIDGNQALVHVRRIANELCEQSGIHRQGVEAASFREMVRDLVQLTIKHRDGRQCLFDRTQVPKLNYEADLCVGAIRFDLTETVRTLLPLLKRGRVESSRFSWLFGYGLDVAVRYAGDKMLELLLRKDESGASLDYQLEALAHASKAGRVDRVQFIHHLKTSMPPGFEGSDEYWRLRRFHISDAHATPSAKVWDLFSEYNYFHKPRPSSWTVKYYLLRSAGEGWLDMTEKFLSWGADPNGDPGITYRGLAGTPMENASQSGHLDIVRTLLHHGAETRTALTKAAHNGHTDIVRLLLHHGADTEGALSGAAARGYMDIVRLLLDHGVNPNGDTAHPLASAIELEHVAMFWLLKRRGATLSVEARKECIQMAEEKGLESMLGVLETYADLEDFIQGCDEMTTDVALWVRASALQIGEDDEEHGK